MSSHRVHCFSCDMSYEQTGPRPHLCGSCGSGEIGVHSGLGEGATWSVLLVGPEGPRESHQATEAEIGHLVQTMVAAGVDSTHAVVITPPGAGVEASSWLISPTRPVLCSSCCGMLDPTGRCHSCMPPERTGAHDVG